MDQELDRVLREINKELRDIKRQMVVKRRGVVTNASPLEVALGGADDSYTEVAAVDGVTPLLGDHVWCDVWGNDILVTGIVA